MREWLIALRKAKKTDADSACRRSRNLSELCNVNRDWQTQSSGLDGKEDRRRARLRVAEVL